MRSNASFAMLVLGLVAAGLLIGPDSVAQESFDGRVDIGALMSLAEQQFDMDQEDAIFLMDRQRQSWLPDGRRELFVHRIIWIATDNAVEHYGDHRAPYDHEHCNFATNTLRTWRDGRWWETGATGKVETLPRAVNHAYDYANMREMMLLHDGVELPCIVEVAYTIADKEPFRGGIDGMWLFQRENPAVVSRFEFEVPKGVTVRFACSEENLQPEPSADDMRGTITHVWEMRNLAMRPRPHTTDPAAYVPHVLFSTWKDWMEFGKYLSGQFGSGVLADSGLVAVVDSLEDESRSEAELVDLIAGFVGERVKLVRYSQRYWWSFPREASRTWTSGYGHPLDRAILAAALLKEAGIEVYPAFVSSGTSQPGAGNIQQLTSVPTLARLPELYLWLEKSHESPFDGPFYNPGNSSIMSGKNAFLGRTAWWPPRLSSPVVLSNRGRTEGDFDLKLAIEYDADKGVFKGKGGLRSGGYLSAYSRMMGLSGQGESYLSSVLSGVLEEAELKGYSFARFEVDLVDVGFDFEMKVPDLDDNGRVALVFGEPDGGLMGSLPDDIALYHNRRSSPVSLPGPMTQTIEIRLDTADIEIVYQPRVRAVRNDGGHVEISVEEKGGKVRLTRETKLTRNTYQASEWTDLRELLLAETSERNRTLLLKVIEAKKDSEKEKKSSDK